MRALLTASVLGFVLMAAPANAQRAGQAAGHESSYETGAAAFRAGRPHDALASLGAVVAEQPGYRDAQLLLGQSFLMLGLEREAKRQFEQLLARQPDNGQVAFLVGFSLYRASRWFEAVEAFDRAHALARANPYPRLYRGLARLKLGDPVAARTDIQTALRLAPDDDAVQAATAELEFAEGDFHAAELRLRPLAERTKDLEQLILLARTLVEQGQAAGAVEVLATIDSDRSALLYVRAQALLRSGARDLGREELARFRERKKIEERLRLLEATASTAPDDVDTRLELTDLMIDEGQLGGAMHQLAALGRLLPGDRRVAVLADRIEKLRP